LRMDHFIKSGASYFRPAGPATPQPLCKLTLERRVVVGNTPIARKACTGSMKITLPITLFDDGSYDMGNTNFLCSDANKVDGRDGNDQCLLWFIALLQVLAMYVAACGLTQLGSRYSGVVALRIIAVPVAIKRAFIWFRNQYLLGYTFASLSMKVISRFRRMTWRERGMRVCKVLWKRICSGRRSARNEEKRSDRNEEEGPEYPFQKWCHQACYLMSLINQARRSFGIRTIDSLYDILLSPLNAPSPEHLRASLTAMLSDAAKEACARDPAVVHQWIDRLSKELYKQHASEETPQTSGARMFAQNWVKEDHSRTGRTIGDKTVGLRWKNVGPEQPTKGKEHPLIKTLNDKLRTVNEKLRQKKQQQKQQTDQRLARVLRLEKFDVEKLHLHSMFRIFDISVILEDGSRWVPQNLLPPVASRDMEVRLNAVLSMLDNGLVVPTAHVPSVPLVLPSMARQRQFASGRISVRRGKILINQRPSGSSPSHHHRRWRPVSTEFAIGSSSSSAREVKIIVQP